MVAALVPLQRETGMDRPLGRGTSRLRDSYGRVPAF